MERSQIEELMAENFPWVESHEREWENVHDGKLPKLEAIAKLLQLYIGAPEVLVLVLSDPEVAAVVSLAEAPQFIGQHVLKGRIHVSDPEFTGFVVVQPIGVATGWRATK
jgi:hypothetical protein